MCWWELGSEAYRLMQGDWLEHAHPLALVSLLDIIGKEEEEEEEEKEEKEEEEVLFHSVLYFSHSIQVLSLHFFDSRRPLV